MTLAHQALVSAHQPRHDKALELVEKSETIIHESHLSSHARAAAVRLTCERARGNVEQQRGEADAAERTFERGRLAAVETGDKLEEPSLTRTKARHASSLGTLSMRPLTRPTLTT